MENKAFSKILTLVTLIVFIGGGIFAWRYFNTFKKEIKIQQETIKSEIIGKVNELSEEIEDLQDLINEVGKLRIVSGLVDRDGQIKRGTGFSVNKRYPGGYEIIFDTPFKNPPVVTASIDDGEKPAGFIGVVHFSLDNRVDIYTMKDYSSQYGSGTLDARGFSFIAVGLK